MYQTGLSYHRSQEPTIEQLYSWQKDGQKLNAHQRWRIQKHEENMRKRNKNKPKKGKTKPKKPSGL